MTTGTRTLMAAVGRRCLLAVVALWLFPVGAAGSAGQEQGAGLAGAFAVSIAVEDVPRDLGNGPTLIGRWRVEFGGDGAYAVGREDVGVLVTGRYAVEGNRVTLRDAGGLLACAPGADGQPAAGVYEWELAGGRLGLVVVEEPCAARRLLLTTRTLSVFVPCPIAGPEVGGPDAAAFQAGSSPTAATPVGATLDAAAAATPPGSPAEIVPGATPGATPGAASGVPAPAEAEAAIDGLLAEMTSCWATRQPERFLALVTAEHRARLVGDDEDDLGWFAVRMAAPLDWSRVGAAVALDPARVAAEVREIAGDEVDVARHVFVFEGGGWRWDGPAEG